MQFNLVAQLTVVAAILAAAPALANPVPEPSIAATAVQGSATFVSSWWEAGLTRYRFYYNGVDGNSFVHAFQNCGGITNNWQSWNENGHGVFDDSEVVGVAGARVISCGIQAVTGQDCHSISEIGC